MNHVFVVQTYSPFHYKVHFFKPCTIGNEYLIRIMLATVHMNNHLINEPLFTEIKEVLELSGEILKENLNEFILNLRSKLGVERVFINY